MKDKLGGLTGDDYVYTDTDINYLMRGGNYEMAVNTLSDWLSAAREESAPYETAADVLDMFGALPEEVAVLRYSSAHVMNLQQKAKVPRKTMKAMDKADRENTIVDMYVNGHSFEDIMAVSGYNSRSSVFSVLNRHGVKLNRGKFKGPLGKRKPKDGQ